VPVAAAREAVLPAADAVRPAPAPDAIEVRVYADDGAISSLTAPLTERSA
jgi:hypothetical protein